jgi:CRP-like cAMP-binding protein
MDLRTFLMRTPAFVEKAEAERFASNWTPKLVFKGACIISQGEQEDKEIILLEGCAASCINDRGGKTICVGLYIGPCIISPNIARTRNGQSLVSVDATTDVLMAQMDSNVLLDLMITSEPVRDWANGILREELARKADREWCLAALSGSDRLDWFRERFPRHEQTFVHTLIASYLGITPVTLSRLRSGAKIT